MPFWTDWARDDGGEGRQMFATQDEAKAAARSVHGVALVSADPVGSAIVFRHGQELDSAEAAEATLKFRHKIEVGMSRLEEPESNIDPGDSTGSGWRPGTLAAYGWRLWTPKAPGDWVGAFPSPETAVEAAEEAQRSDPELAGLPIVRIDS